MRILTLLSAPVPTAQEQHLLRLAAAMGVTAKSVPVPGSSPSLHRLLAELPPGLGCLAMTAATLAALQQNLPVGDSLGRLLQDSCADLLVFGCDATPGHTAALTALTGGAAGPMTQASGTQRLFVFPREAALHSCQFAGLHYSRPAGEPLPVFAPRPGLSSTGVIFAVNDCPLFLRIARGGLQIYLLAGAALPDADEPLAPGHGLPDFYDRLLPVLLFFRRVFGDACWRGPAPSARLIIDDPLLTARYGFLDYAALLHSMRRHRYGTSIAFIPWNCWRSSRRNVARLLHESSSLSICIHGCDHTNREFEAQDPAFLDRIAALAMERMESQQRRTGAPFAPVMVFPQGRFSAAAIPALRANRFLAAVNSTCCPSNGGPAPALGDLLQPAVTRYGGLPLFHRHYPRHLIDFACDLFLGKPALIVEHHAFVRGGLGPLEEFVAALYRIQPDLAWPGLTEQLSRSCRIRTLTNGSAEVRFFTPEFHLSPRSGHVLLSKAEPDPTAVHGVLLDGAPVPFSCRDGLLQLEVAACDAVRPRTVQVLGRRRARQKAAGLGFVHNTGVLLRRGLSEFRDNTLARHDGLLRVARGVARGLKVTGDS